MILEARVSEIRMFTIPCKLNFSWYIVSPEVLMKKDSKLKIGEKNAAKEVSEKFKKNREKPFSKEIYEIAEGYRKEQEKKERKIASKNNEDAEL